jgi:hypothetical protein
MQTYKSMIVTAWNNGSHSPTGAGYGIKIKITDRDKYFDKKWKNIDLCLGGTSKYIKINVSKKSFWDCRCHELSSKRIGVWLKENKKDVWPIYHPPKMIMKKMQGNKFKVNLVD